MNRDSDPGRHFSRATLREVTFGDPALGRQLVTLFLDQAADTRRSLLLAAQAGREPFADALHRLKSTSYFVGGARLFRHLEQRELDLGTAQDRMAAALTLHELLAALERELRAEFSGERDPRRIQGEGRR